MLNAYIIGNRVVIWDFNKAKDIFEKEYFGRLKPDRLELSLIEALYLLEKKRIKIYKDGKSLKKNEFISYCRNIDSRFELRYTVYKDLKDKELPTRTGFKFGCDFRVYEKGVKPLKRGPKSRKEHTKWVVYAVPKKYKCSFAELSRAVRLAHNIRANMLWALVDGKKVKYYQVKFFKP